MICCSRGALTPKRSRRVRAPGLQLLLILRAIPGLTPLTTRVVLYDDICSHTMKTSPRISETEWEVMRIVWARHPLPAAGIIAALQAQDATWHPKTARTLLARLVQKGALEYQKLGRAYVYEPKVTERECIAAASDSFLDRVFGGALQPMLVHFVRERGLSKKELEALREIVDTADRKTSRGKK